MTVNILLYIGSSTLGENFNPAKDCSDIVDNLPEAKDGFYWIKHNKGKSFKVKTIAQLACRSFHRKFLSLAHAFSACKCGEHILFFYKPTMTIHVLLLIMIIYI
jgi:hypothetical protein